MTAKQCFHSFESMKTTKKTLGGNFFVKLVSKVRKSIKQYRGKLSYSSKEPRNSWPIIIKKLNSRTLIYYSGTTTNLLDFFSSWIQNLNVDLQNDYR